MEPRGLQVRLVGLDGVRLDFSLPLFKTLPGIIRYGDRTFYRDLTSFGRDFIRYEEARFVYTITQDDVALSIGRTSTPPSPSPDVPVLADDEWSGPT